jgi:hypothetical protein
MAHGIHIVKESLSPGEFFASQQRFLALMIFENHLVDIRGQLEAGQVATAALISRMALQRGVLAYLLERGGTGLSIDNVWAAFRVFCGADSDLFARAEALLVSNPDSDADVRFFAEQCIEFVTSELKVSGLGYTEASFERYKAHTRDLAHLARLMKVNT